MEGEGRVEEGRRHRIEGWLVERWRRGVGMLLAACARDRGRRGAVVSDGSG